MSKKDFSRDLSGIALAFLSIFTLMFAVGCSSVKTDGTSKAPTVTITASPTSINAGASSTLTVTATNATQVTISGSDGSSYTLAAQGGTQSVTPSATTTYTATAMGTGGITTAAAAVTVSGGAATVTITASPTSIAAGSSSTLTVTATNATAVTVTGSDGSSYTLAITGGTKAVTPTATTTYTATATGATGNVTATATVTVTGSTSPATVTITANPTSIAAGGSSTLTVTATNATAVTVTGSDGSSYTLAITGGTKTVTPTATTTYTATATGSTGNVTATATVTVTATNSTTVTITANPTTVAAGGSSTLTVTAANATAVSVTGTDGTTYTMSATGGTQAVTPASTTTYTATATGAAGNVTATATVTVTPTVTIVANPTTITAGSSSTLQVTASAATGVTVTGTDGSSYTLAATGGTQSVSPSATTTYTATATNAAGDAATATAAVTVQSATDVQAIKHVVFMLQENHSFDNYFGMLNPYRHSQGMYKGDDGVDYEVDGLDDKLGTISNQDDEGDTFQLFKLKSTCVDDMSSDWLSSYGDVDRYNFTTTRPIKLDGFVHNAEGYAKSCSAANSCSGAFTDLKGQRSMGYYDQGFLNYYYYMASQFAISDRWFSPVSSKSVDNRIATFSGGTTQGIVKDPGNDKIGQLNIPTIFQELDQNNVSWKIYFTVTQGFCTSESTCTGNRYPATDFSNFVYSSKYLYQNPTGGACAAPTQQSSVIGDSTNSFCIDTTHIAPISQYYTDATNNTLPSFAFIEAGYGDNDEHPGSGQSILYGQAQSAQVVNALMTSTSWPSSVFFLAYDEGGGPYDHVPPVPGHSNDNTNPALGTIPDISQIAVNADGYKPCLTDGSAHCDLSSTDPGANAADAAAQQGFAAQLGFRLPNIIISPFTRKHYVSHTPMDHTAVIKFVENRFINSSAHLTARDAVQSNLLEFFDFAAPPWATPPSPPAPVTSSSLGYDPCTPASMGP